MGEQPGKMVPVTVTASRLIEHFPGSGCCSKQSVQTHPPARGLRLDSEGEGWAEIYEVELLQFSGSA